jgi:hypothetical protein
MIFPTHRAIPVADIDFDALAAALKARFERLKATSESSSREASFVAHVQSLAKWQEEATDDYPNIDEEFPQSIWLAFAVCLPECGGREFIVDGGSQECQHCGRLMFRRESKLYEIAGRAEPKA